jgi:hypothetical protein
MIILGALSTPAPRRAARFLLLVSLVGLGALLIPLGGGGLLVPSLLATSSAVAASPPVAITNEATEVKRARATLVGYVLPQPPGENTVYYFEYGTKACSAITETCGVKTPTRGPVTEEGFAEPFKLTRLKPGTTYHFWFVASSAGGTAHGEEMTFTTVVAEPKEFVFEKNLSGHTFEHSWGVAVNRETQDIYASDNGAIEQYNAKGVWLSSVAMPASGSTRQLAIDNSCYYQKLTESECKTQDQSNGDVYIVDESDNLIYKFDPSANGELTLDGSTPSIGAGVLNLPVGVAVDATGDVYVASEGSGTVSKFSPTGGHLDQTFITGLSAPAALAFDTLGNIYVAGGSGTVEFTSAGVCVSLPCTPINSDYDFGVAVDTVGDIFISDFATQSVDEYGPGSGNPLIANPQLEKAGAFSVPADIAVNNTDHTLYVANYSGAVVEAFEYLEIKPVIVKTEPATQVSGAVEALNGHVNPNGKEAAEYYFEYGLSPCLPETCGTVATEQSQVPLNGDEEIPVSVRLDNLPPNATFHFRVVGVNEESGVEYGGEQTFTTGPEASPLSPSDESEHKAPPGAQPAPAVEYPSLTGIAPVPGPKESTHAGSKPLTRNQRLQRALRSCHKLHKKSKRQKCERLVHKAFAPHPTKHGKKR